MRLTFTTRGGLTYSYFENYIYTHYLRSQWWRGLSKAGNIGYYSESTIRIKKSLKLPYDRVTLFHTGNLYSKIKVIPEHDGLYVSSGVFYFKKLILKYSENILQLHYSEFEHFNERFIFNVQKEIFRIWKGK